MPPEYQQFEDVTAESLDAAAQRLLGQDTAPTEEEEEEPDAGDSAPGTEQDEPSAPGPGTEPEGEEEPAQAGEPAPVVPSSDFTGYRFDDLGVVIDEQAARIYAETDYRLRNDPAFLEAFQRALGLGGQPSGEQAAPPAPASTPDPYDRPEEYAAWIREQTRQEILKELAPHLGRVDAHDRFIQDQGRQTAARIVESVVTSFQTDKGLTAEEMKEIRGIAQIKPGDPDPYHQVQEAFEVAYWSIPRFREKALTEERARWEEDRKRQKKLAAVTGNSGSVPRTPPEPRNVDERKAGLRAAVEEIWRGNAINE
jgi:hypothetical protein